MIIGFESSSIFLRYIIDGSGSVKEVAKRIEADFNGYSCN